MRSLLLLCLALSLPLAAAEVPDRLASARALLAAGKSAEALLDLQSLSGVPGASLRQQADLEALRAAALLGLPPSPEHRQDATTALVQMFHLDPDATALVNAGEPVQGLARELRSQRALVLHDRLVTVRSGRPVRVRARLAGATLGEPQLFLSYRRESAEDDYIRVQMDHAAAPGLFEFWLRPGLGGVPGGGEQVLRYFIEATGPGGAVLDSNGTAKDPIRLQLSETLPEAAGIAALDEGGKPAHPVALPPPTPWYKRAEIVGPAAGVLVVGGIVALILLQPKPQPASGSLGRVDLP